ncbi:S-adenosyl-L-methionine-dependent methyltransferase [Dichotomocladium elegans]|nr:S-adenosyl-L-methionine-dependent methyltransferase [Dichotomocladium elegans]
MPRWRLLDKQWIRRLLPACDGDMALAQRHLVWIKQSATDHGGNVQPAVVQRSIHDRVVHHKPLQYILGTQPFGDLDIVTRPPVLIPRWETEEWVHRLVDMLRPHLLQEQQQEQSLPFRILDICTGTGCIALALASQLPNVQVTAIDIAPAAVALAKHNQTIHGIGNVTITQMDVFHLQQQQPFDLVVSNPPYITRDEYEHLSPDVKHWEDPRALVADDQGLAVHQHIAALCAQGLLKTTQRHNSSSSNRPALPKLLMEFGGTHQVSALKHMLSPVFDHVEIWKDLAGKDRVVVAS